MASLSLVAVVVMGGRPGVISLWGLFLDRTPAIR